MSRTRKILAAAAVVLALGSVVAFAHRRLTVGATQLFWASPTNISIVINDAGSDNVGDASHFTAIRNGIDAWNDASGNTATMVEITTPSEQARTDWASSGVHLVLFDENNSTGWFTPPSSTVALTPLFFSGSGAIVDSDILFNGMSFSFTTSGQPGFYDVQDVVTHELGHFLGLDHTGWIGGSMYPFVSPGWILQRSISVDEAHGLRDIYPSVAYSSITGSIARVSDSSPVLGAHVSVWDANGRTSGGTLANGAGNFTVAGLDPGTYTVCVDPLDGSVTSANFNLNHAVETDFESFVGAPFVVGPGANAHPTIMVDADVGIHVTSPLGGTPVQAEQGDTRTIFFGGSGLLAGTTLATSSPDVTFAATVGSGSSISTQMTVAPGAAIGHVDVIATLGADMDLLPAALEIVPVEPNLLNVNPTVGDSAGGTALTLNGSDFRAGSRVVIGENIYRDGSGATVSASSITLTTAATSAGFHDVVVIDPSGLEDRLVSGFEAVLQPTISTSFPLAGTSVGGTLLTLKGSQFLAGLSVRIDGSLQGTVFVDNVNTVRVITDAGVPGGPYLVDVQNPGGGSASTAFSFVVSQDPVVTMATPATGTTAGGDMVMVIGAGFTATDNVVFGADPETGQGGVMAASVNFIDANTLEVTTPARAVGSASVLVSNVNTMQAGVLPGAFTFVSGGGGGGGCYFVPFEGPGAGLREMLTSCAWLLLTVVFLGAHALRNRPRPVPVQ